MKTFTDNEELTFTKNYTKILACTTLCPTEKLIIARVLAWQQNDLICRQSNQTLSKELGISLNTLKGAIKRLNRTPFFKSEETSKFNEFGTWTNSREIIIDEAALFDFVTSNEPKPKPKKQTEIEEPIQPETTKIEPVQDEEFDDESENLPSQKEYTDIGFKINNGQTVYILKQYQKYWDKILTQKGSVNRLKRECDQVNFDMELDRVCDNLFQIQQYLK